MSGQADMTDEGWEERMAARTAQRRAIEARQAYRDDPSLAETLATFLAAHPDLDAEEVEAVTWAAETFPGEGHAYDPNEFAWSAVEAWASIADACPGCDEARRGSPLHFGWRLVRVCTGCEHEHHLDEVWIAG